MIRKISYILCFAVIFLIAAEIFPYNVNAVDKNTFIDAKIYEFNEKSEYEISSSESASNAASLGKFIINGNVRSSGVKENFPAFEISDGVLSFAYTYDDSLLNASGTDEHLTSDNKKAVNGIDLGEKVQNGAVILQTSLDGQKWTVNYKQTNVFEDTPVQTEPFYETNDI